MSNVVRLHKRQGTRLRVYRVDAPRTVIPEEETGAAPGTLPETAPGADSRPDPVTVPIDNGEMSKRLQRAYEKGRVEGRAEAEAEIQKRLAIARAETDDRIGALMGGIARQVRAFTASLEHDAYQFSLAVAERIVKREIARDDEVVVRQVREAIRRIVGVETIRLRIHPDDEALVRSHRAELLASADSIRDVAIEPDDSLERGGCVIESSSGNVDARIATQLRQIDTALFARNTAEQERVL